MNSASLHMAIPGTSQHIIDSRSGKASYTQSLCEQLSLVRQNGSQALPHTVTHEHGCCTAFIQPLLRVDQCSTPGYVLTTAAHQWPTYTVWHAAVVNMRAVCSGHNNQLYCHSYTAYRVC